MVTFGNPRPTSRSPQGGRGLKPKLFAVQGAEDGSLSARRAWIETGTLELYGFIEWVALRKEGVD